jgi:hypothetical protein
VPNRICFVELPTAATDPAKSFYAKVFGFAMTDFGPTYSCTMTGDVDLGLQADAKEASRAPLPVIQVESLEATETEVKLFCKIAPCLPRMPGNCALGVEYALYAGLAQVDGSGLLRRSPELNKSQTLRQK